MRSVSPFTRASYAGHDAHDGMGGDIQIKMTAGHSVAMYAECVRLVVFRVVSPEEAEIVYDGPGAPAWRWRLAGSTRSRFTVRLQF